MNHLLYLMSFCRGGERRDSIYLYAKPKYISNSLQYISFLFLVNVNDRGDFSPIKATACPFSVTSNDPPMQSVWNK